MTKQKKEKGGALLGHGALIKINTVCQKFTVCRTTKFGNNERESLMCCFIYFRAYVVSREDGGASQERTVLLPRVRADQQV